MNTAAGRVAHPAPTLLALRGLVQKVEFKPFKPAAFDKGQVDTVGELSKGFPVSNVDFSEALHAQQREMGQMFKELGFHEAAGRIEDRLGSETVTRQREH